MTRKDNPTLDAALHYAELGWSVIPLCWPGHEPHCAPMHSCDPKKKGKVPLIPWKEHQEDCALPVDIMRWWTRWPLANVGVVMGSVSGLVAWDIDDLEGMDLMVELFGDQEDGSVMFETGSGGLRVLYRWPGELPPPPAHFKTGGKALSFLGEGSQTVMPPSAHRSGNPYRWTPGYGLGEVEFNTVSPQMVAKLHAHRPPVERMSGGPCSPFDLRGGLEASPRARAWARNFEAGYDGEGGRRVCFTLACSLVHGFGLSEEETYQVMAHNWNAKCKPPFEEWELRSQIRCAAQKGTFRVIEERRKLGGR